MSEAITTPAIPTTIHYQGNGFFSSSALSSPSATFDSSFDTSVDSFEPSLVPYFVTEPPFGKDNNHATVSEQTSLE